jgi:GntR family transcriptional regulator
MELRDRRPLSVQVHARLRNQILGGEYAPGERLPSEAELATQLGVSRITIREALKMLQRDFLIHSVHGRGHFIFKLPKSVRRPISDLQGVTELMASRGYSVENVILEVRQEPAAEYAEPLGLNSNESVVRLERLRLSEGDPMIYSVDVFPARFVELMDIDWSGSLLQILDPIAGRITYARASIRAVTLPRSVAQKAGLPRALPWILLEQVSFTAEHLPVLYSLDYHRGDEFEFYVLRERRSHP